MNHFFFGARTHLNMYRHCTIWLTPRPPEFRPVLFLVHYFDVCVGGEGCRKESDGRKHEGLYEFKRRWLKSCLNVYP